MKIYLSGPMSGYDNYNFPAFDYAADLLRAEGHEVFSPADNDRRLGLTGEVGVPFPPGVTPNTLIKCDLLWIIDHADTIAFLPGYEKSLGAACESTTARFLGLNNLVLGKRYLAGAEYVNAWSHETPRALVAPHDGADA